MTRQGFIAALDHSEQLPVFANIDAAREQLTKVKDETLHQLLIELASLKLDFSEESLKRLERWYFEASCPVAGATGYSVPHALGFYLGEVLCQSGKFQWVVEEDMLLSDRFAIGVRQGRCTIFLMRGRTPSLKGNVRMQSLWRECQKFLTVFAKRD
jgi:hypothetical protein